MKKFLQFGFYFLLGYLSTQYAQAQGDNCTNAQVINALPFQDTGTTDGALYDYDASCGSGGNGAPDVVYRYTSPSNGFINISLCEAGSTTDYDTKMWVYRGSCSSAQEVACSDDACNNPGLVNNDLISRITNMPVSSGQTYFIVIGGFSEFEFGNFSIQVSTTSPTAGTDCSNPLVINNLPFNASANTATFGDDIELTPCSNNNLIAGDEVVYTYTPTADEFVDIQVSNISASGSLLITDNCPDAVGAQCVAEAFGGGSATELNINSLELNGGQTYYIVISTFPSPQSTNYTLDINPGTEPPVGSDCTNPIIIPSIPYQDLGKNTVDYGDDYDDSPCNPSGTDYMGGNEIVYTYTATQNREIGITLKNISADFTALHILNNCPDIATNCFAFAANTNSRDDLQVQLSIQTGTTYYIVVSTWPNPQSTGFDLFIDEPSGVNISIDPSKGSEADQTVFTVTATSNTPVSSDQTVEVQVEGTGITLNDFILSSQRITIPAGQVSGSVTFTVQDDNLGEGTEIATIALINPSSGIVLGSFTEKSITILDNDNLVSLDISKNTTTENTTENILLTIHTTEPVAGEQQVDVRFAGEGVDDDDLSLSDSRFIIPDGGQNAQISIQIKNDHIAEGDETVRFSLNNPSELIGLANDSVQFLTILDDEFKPSAFADTYSLDEDQVLQVETPGILANDTDEDLDILSANLMTLPTHGSLLLQSSGKFRYVPEPDFAGQDSFTYQANDGFNNSETVIVTLEVNSVNDLPRILRNLTLRIVPEASLIPLDTNYLQMEDVEDEDSTLTFTLLSSPVQGQLLLNGNVLGLNDTFKQADINRERLRYTHLGTTSGYDQFNFRVTDSENGQSEEITFFVLIDVVNAGEEDILQGSTQIRPNPSADHFSIFLNNTLRGTLQIRVRDSQGKLIRYFSQYKSKDALDILLDFENEKPGLYLLELQLGLRRAFWKLVKE
ncbi:MAG: Ig-like domain-containing protein [Microscillaceae bacterium]|nr:Ig-like domain-containing protein [Microscillaceae bacterium]